MSTWGFSLSIVVLKVINFPLGFFFSYVHVITVKVKFYSRLRGNMFGPFNKIILMSWDRSQFCHDSQLLSADKNPHTCSLGRNPIPWPSYFEILCYSEDYGRFWSDVYVLVFQISRRCCFCRLVFVLFYFFLSLFLCYLLVIFFLLIDSYSYILVCLEI